MRNEQIDYGIGGRIVIVTGAGKGIGRETSIQFAKLGASVALVGRNLSSVKETEAEIHAFGGEATAYECDVASEGSVNDVVDDVFRKHGRIDILVNNAGIEADREEGQMGGDVLMQTPLDEYKRVLGTNLIGHYNFMRAAIPHMVGQHFGRIVNITSCTAYTGAVGTAAYVASKAGAIAQTKAFARQFGPDNILINSVAPGMVDTPMHDKTPKEMFAGVAGITPLRRIAQPIDIARAVLFLSQEDLFITGETIIPDGGVSMR